MMIAYIIDSELHLNTSYTSINFSDKFFFTLSNYNFLIIVDNVDSLKHNLYFSVHVHYVYI